MRVIVNLVFWTLAAVLSVPAILGITAGLAALALVMLVGFLIAIVALAVMVLCCVPIIWWCAVFDGTKVYGYLSKLQVATKSQVAPSN